MNIAVSLTSDTPRTQVFLVYQKELEFYV